MLFREGIGVGTRKRGGGTRVFDFGGTEGEVKYPANYKPTPPDGCRKGREGNATTNFHGYYGL